MNFQNTRIFLQSLLTAAEFGMGVKEITSNTGTDYCLSRWPCLSTLILNMVLHNLINNFRIQVFINYWRFALFPCIC